VRISTNVHLNQEDKIKSIGVANNFGNLQYEISFESGNFIIIDEVFLQELDKLRPNKEE
jgi:hypothetical protein